MPNIIPNLGYPTNKQLCIDKAYIINTCKYIHKYSNYYADVQQVNVIIIMDITNNLWHYIDYYHKNN